MPLTEKQRFFAEEYLIDLNATRAYKQVYKSCKKDETASVNASKLLRNTNIQNYIKEKLENKHNEKIASVDEVLEYLTAVMRGEYDEEVVVVEGIGDGESEARTIEKKVGAKERIKAAELLGKRYALFTDNIKHSGAIDVVQIIDNIPKVNNASSAD